MDQSKNQITSYPSHYGPYPINPNLIQKYQPNFLRGHQNSSPCTPILPLSTTLKLDYWELLSPALIGAAGGLLLSLFSGDKKDTNEHFEGVLFKLAIIGYSIGASISTSFAIKKAITASRPSYNYLFLPVAGAIISIILFFGAEYLLLYRFFPSSFKGDVGDNFWTQLFSFIYLSITTITTAGMGDIMPNNLTARALIAIEISFYLFTMATAVPLLLVQKL